jgi:hypothetical protein
MLLREHPLMCYRGVRNWPPTWIWVGGEANERPRGEVGILIHVMPSVLEAKKLFLTIEHNENEYMGCLLFEDATFSHQIYSMLRRFYHHSTEEIGSIDLSHTL